MIQVLNVIEFLALGCVWLMTVFAAVVLLVLAVRTISRSSYRCPQTAWVVALVVASTALSFWISNITFNYARGYYATADAIQKAEPTVTTTTVIPGQRITSKNRTPGTYRVIGLFIGIGGIIWCPLPLFGALYWSTKQLDAIAKQKPPTEPAS